MKLTFAFLFVCLTPFSIAQVPSWIPKDPGLPEISRSGDRVQLGNSAISVRWNLSNGIWLDRIVNEFTSEVSLQDCPAFTVYFENGESVNPSQMLKSNGTFWRRTLLPRELMDKRGEESKSQIQYLVEPKSGLQVLWSATLASGENAIRGFVLFGTSKADINIKTIRLLEITAKNPRVVGTVNGSPLVAENLFFGVEHPMSISKVENGKAIGEINRKVPLQKGQFAVYSYVIGSSPTKQMRRAFNFYLENTRPRKYFPFLHYNSWYDLAFGGQFSSDDCVERIKTFGTELVQKRQVHLQSFLFDDGWDDTSNIWKFHSRFPDGFGPLRIEASKFGAAPGVWLSPWGGYGRSRNERLSAGKSAGLEIDSQGFALSGKKYYQLFRSTCLDFVRTYGVNQFKFDGTGSPDKQFPGSAFGSDFEAAISLIRDLRQANQSLFINLTTGTWPSPFWLNIADSIWRGGSDHSFAGVGSWRQKWITYRDGQTYNGVVKKGPLFPLTSLMVHGIIYAEHADHLSDDPGDDFRSELISYFGSGTQLQELYVTPKLLTQRNWDDIAMAAKWSELNRKTLVDTHWIGGDPLKLEVYGWASWGDGKGIVVLRNPNEFPQAYSLEIDRAFELPYGSSGKWIANSPFDEKMVVELTIGKAKVFDLKPFEVLVLEGEMPQ